MLGRADLERALLRPWLLVLLVVLAVGVPVLATGELGARDAQERLHRSTIAAAGESALRAASEVDLRLSLIKDALARANGLPLYNALTTRNAAAATDLITAELGQGQTTLGFVQPYTTRNAWIVDAAGQSLATVKGVGVALPSVNGRPFFDRATKSVTRIGVRPDDVFVTDNVRFELPFLIESPLAVEPLGDGVTFGGALIVQIHTSALGDALKAQLGSVEDVVIFDGTGRLVSRASEPDANFTDLSGTSFVQQALSGKQVLGDVDDAFGAGPRVAAVAPVGDSGWRVAAIVGPTAAERDLADSLAQQRTIRLALFAILLIGTYLFAGVLSGSIRRRRALAESLERESATSKVLQVMSRSAFDVDGVFRAILTSAIRICDADWGAIDRTDGDRSVQALQIGGPPGFAESLRRKRAGPTEDVLGARVRHEKRPIHVVDAQRDLPGEGIPGDWYRTALIVPMLRDDVVIGSIALYRYDVEVTDKVMSGGAFGDTGAVRDNAAQPKPSSRSVRRGLALRPFSESEIALVQTFADQAAIAIENVRLFNETREALAQQTAVAEVLKTISGQAFDLQPVLDAVIASAVRLCAADNGFVFRYEAGAYRTAASFGVPAELVGFQFAKGLMRLDEPTLERVGHYGTVQIIDVLAEADVPPGLLEDQARGGFRTVLGVPMRREGVVLGVISLRRNVVQAFSDREIALVETFADQAVIAIENARLFNETKEALRQQTATAEVLRSISRATFDLPAVLQTLVDRAAELCEADQGWLRRYESQRTTIALAVTKNAYSRERVLADGVTEFDPGSMSARVLAERRSIQLDTSTDPYYRDPVVGSWHQLNPNPDPRPHTFLGVPMMRDGTCIGLLLMLRDVARPFTPEQVALIETFADQAVIAMENVRLITEIQEKSRELEVASKHKSEFLANMSHELRTPLNAIIGFADVLGQKMFGELNPKQTDYLADIGTSGRHLLDLVNQILDLSKVEAGRMEIEPSAFAPGETIRASLAFIRERAAAHRIQVAAEIPADLPTVTGDERKLRQVLLNLLSNAVKFTPDGGWIGVTARAVDGQLEIAVKDTGIGIPPEDQAVVFEEFRQVGQGADRSREGTGLGLTLAKRFVELHGGRIWVESAVGTGSTFTFAIPVERPAAVVAG